MKGQDQRLMLSLRLFLNVKYTTKKTQAKVWMIKHTHTLAEGAGAALLAAAYRLRDELKGKKMGMVCSGGNTSLEHLRQALKRAGLFKR